MSLGGINAAFFLKMFYLFYKNILEIFSFGLKKLCCKSFYKNFSENKTERKGI